MEKFGLDLDMGSSPGDTKQANPQEARTQSIQRCIQSLVHACQCREANCRPTCQKMKRVIAHTKICKRKTNGGCPICKQLIALGCYHAKHCQETKCPVPFCSNIKQKLKQQQLQQRLQQQQLQQRLQQQQLLRRCMATMNTRGAMCTGSNTPPPAAPMASPPPPSKPPAPHSPTANVLQVEKQVQKEAPHYSNAGPPLSDAWEQTYRPAQPSPLGHHLLQSGVVPSGAVPTAGVVPQDYVLQRPPSATHPHEKALQQLIDTLRSPTSPDQQAEIMQILKSNPPLMAAFIKHRQQQQKQQQQQQQQEQQQQQQQTPQQQQQQQQWLQQMHFLGQRQQDRARQPPTLATPKKKIQRRIQSLVHAYHCTEANCRPTCQEMKRVIAHTKICKRKINDGCLICKQIVALCWYHAQHCQGTSNCSVKSCSNIKQLLRQTEFATYYTTQGPI